MALNSAFKDFLKSFEVRDTDLVGLINKVEEYPALVEQFIEARKLNVSYAREALRAILPTDLDELDREVETFVTGGEVL